MDTLPEYYATMRAVPDRETILRLTLADYAKRYGPSIPVDLERLNGLLATYRQPLATLTEVRVWYGAAPPASALN